MSGPPAGTQAGPPESPEGIAGFPGPFAVGRYAAELRSRLRGFARICLLGEISGVRLGRGASVFFELRDADGALPCAMWRADFDRQGLRPEDFRDGAEVVVAGGCDFYPGGATASPRFLFRVSELRLAGEGDLLARLERLRRALAAEGLFERQRSLTRPLLPRSIGVVTAEDGAARRDLVAGLERRGWRGRLVWAWAPVQDRRAAGAIARAVRDLAAFGAVDTIVVTRGGGSIADLWAFCDEALCRSVALLAVPVISAVGHEVDRTLIDDVAARCCSTPTHAAEAAVGVDCRRARADLARAAAHIERRGRAAMLERARALAARSRAPREHLERQRRDLHQEARELRAAGRRGPAARGERMRLLATALERRRVAAGQGTVGARVSLTRLARAFERASGAALSRRSEALEARAAALRAHEPRRALERGYAVLMDAAGEPLSGVEAVRRAGTFEVGMADGTLAARLCESDRKG